MDDFEIFLVVVIKNHIFVFIRFNFMDRGILFVLHYLDMNQEQDICAGDLVNILDVSSARVASLLNDLEQKEYVKREKDENDHRKVFIRLTEKGHQEIKDKTQKARKVFNYVADKVGIEKIRSTLETIQEINQTLKEVRANEEDAEMLNC